MGSISLGPTERIEVRIGIATGDVIAGSIGPAGARNNCEPEGVKGASNLICVSPAQVTFRTPARKSSNCAAVLRPRLAESSAGAGERLFRD